MMHAVAFLAFFVASVCASRTADLGNQVVRGYVDSMTQGLPDDDTIKRVRALFAKLKPEKVKMLYSACCTGGECAEGAAAFLLEQCSSFAGEVEVDECAWQLPSYFTTYVKSFEDVPDALKHLAVTPSDAAFTKGLGLWYLDAGCKADIKESLKEALSYVILSDASAENSGVRAKIVLSSTEKKDFKVLLEYWASQDARRQLAVYRNLQTGGYSDLAVLQPAIFNMECIQSRTCTDGDYSATLSGHIAPLGVCGTALNPLISILLKHPFLKTAEILRKVTGKRPVKADEVLAMMAREFVLQPKSVKELGKLVYQAANPEFYVPESYPDYLILDANKMETFEALDHQILGLVPDLEDFSGSAPFFSHTRVAKYITKRHNAFSQYGELYEKAIQDILEGVLRVGIQDWGAVNPLPTESFGEAAFWELIAFLEEEQHQQYRGLFGQLFLVQHELPGEFSKLVPDGLQVLMQKIAEHTGEGSQLHGELDNIALRMFELRLQNHQLYNDQEHPFFKKQFDTVRQQLTKDLFKAFETQPLAWMCLDKHILNAQVETGRSDGLHELQVDVVAQSFTFVRGSAAKNEEEWKDVLAEYDSRQLANIYAFAATAVFVLKQPQLCKKFDFSAPVRYNHLSQELAELYQLAFPHRESVIRRMLGHLSGDLTDDFFARYGGTLLKLVRTLPENLDFSTGGDDSPWQSLEQNWYAAVDSNDRLGLLRQLYPELADIPSPDDAAVSDCKTFDELRQAMTPNNATP